MRLNILNRIGGSRRIPIALFLTLAGIFVIAGVPEARAFTWNRNQNFQCGHSPGVIPSTYDTQPSCTLAVCPGAPVNIVYGIQDPVGDPATVNLEITLPIQFSVTSVQVLKFPGGTQLPAPSATNLGSFPIGALSAASDKVIVVIDGYFTQAAVYSASFKAVRGSLSESSSLSMDARCPAPPIDISTAKDVKPSGGAFGSTATVAFGTTVTYRVTVKNASTPKPDGSTDLYLGGLLRLQDQMSAPGGSGANDVPLDITVSGFQCTPSSGGVACPALPSASLTATLGPGNVYNLPPMTYPGTGTGSNGFLPAGGSFVITFDVLIKTSRTCSAGQNNKLNNVASVTYSNGTTTIPDQNPANNTSAVTSVTLTGLPSTPCPSPSPTPGIPVDKNPLSPTGTGIVWGATFTYEITITNNTGATLTGLTINDALWGIGAPPFTANFLASNVTCTPACTTVAPPTAAPLVGTAFTPLFSAAFSPLAPNAVQKVKYQVQYVGPGCAETATGGSIINYAYLTGPATGAAQVSTPMPPLPVCPLQAKKTKTQGSTSSSSYPETLGYRVQFTNTSSTDTITVRTLIDAMSLDSPTYGNIPISYLYTCTATGVTGVAPLTKGATPATVQYANRPWAGTKLIAFESAAGAVFAPGGSVDCLLSVTLQQPSTTDSLCQGAGTPRLTNSTFMDLVYGFNTNQATQPVWYQQVTTQLPYCVSIIVGKTAPPDVTPGGPVTFTLTVTNTGKDPVPNVVLQDSVPPAFTNVTWTCASGCATSSGSGNLNVPLTPPLAPGATVTILVKATAPSELGAHCNRDKAIFEPFPALTYFEGDQAALTTAEACIQVVPPVITGTPTPTPTASPRASATPSPTPPQGCAQVTDKEIRCEPTGGYSYTLSATNNTGGPVPQILLSPLPGSTFTLSQQLFNLPAPLAKGQSAPLSLHIGNAKPGDKVCFFVTLMPKDGPCCTVQVCPDLPVCDKR